MTAVLLDFEALSHAEPSFNTKHVEMLAEIITNFEDKHLTGLV